MSRSVRRSRRKPSQYNKFVADMIKCHGMTLTQAAKAWKGDKRTKKTRSKSRHRKSCRLSHKKARSRKVGSHSLKRKSSRKRSRKSRT